MHECRPHSNLWGKHVLWGDEALATDHIGYYKPVLATDLLDKVTAPLLALVSDLGLRC